MTYIFLTKVVGGEVAPIDPPEVERIVSEFCKSQQEYRWVAGQPIEIKNSDGTITTDTTGHLTQGLALLDSDTDEEVISCYGYNDGICIHSDGTEKLMNFCRDMASAYEMEIFTY